MRAAAPIVRAAETEAAIAGAAGVLGAVDVVAAVADVLAAVVVIAAVAGVPVAVVAEGGTRTSSSRIFTDHTGQSTRTERQG